MLHVCVLDFVRTVGRLKRIKRTGWVSSVGVKNPESRKIEVLNEALKHAVLQEFRNT